MVGNDTCLPISHIRNTIPYSNSQIMNFKKYFTYASSIKNLLSVAQFSVDNNYLFELNHTCFIVKDKNSEEDFASRAP